MSEKFYLCKHCGNLVGMIKSSGVPIICCGEKMQALVPNTVDASGEKHLPVVSLADDVLTVKVGAVNHPMSEEHFIEWIYVETDKGGKRILLKPNDLPEINVIVKGEKVISVYAYCNLHGLWKTAL